MAKLLFVGTYGSDNPTRAAMPFMSAAGALEAGHEVTEDDLEGKNATFTTPKEYAERIAAADSVVVY